MLSKTSFNREFKAAFKGGKEFERMGVFKIQHI